MNIRVPLFCTAALLIGIGLARADFLPNNFWPNAAFENGSNLDQTNGTPTGWNQGGSDPTICQVTTNASVSPTHALMVNDTDTGNYGEWYSDLNLAGLANPGDALNVQYYEMYNVPSPEMRVSVLFFDSGNNVLAQNHYTVSGDSPGWVGSIAASTFTKTNQSLVVPLGAVRLRVSVVSGGPSGTTGVLVVDDLSIARVPTSQLLAGNFWTNATFENGTSLDSPTGTPTGWNRGGSDGSICQVTTNNYTSASHALMVSDADTNNYGEWYSDLTLSGHANPGDALTVQWFELFNITNGEMRVSVLFFDSGNNVVQQNHFTATGQSAGWQGAIAGSGFTRRNQPLVVPPNAVKMRVSLVSGGPSETTGVMLVDDLSVAPPQQPAILPGNFWPNPMFEAGTNLNQTNGTPANWIAAGGDTSICQVTTNNYISPTHALAIIDNNTNGYGEWDADLILSTNTSPGDLLDIQYSELYDVTNGSMRLTILFYDGSSNVVGQSDFNVTGPSAGWQGTIAASTFTLQMQQVLVPNNTVRMRISLVSGGPSLTTGVLVIDDLSVARHALPPTPSTVLAGNFFPNPTFEAGVQLDNPTLGLPAGGWQRGGTASSIDQVTTNNSTSPTHSLALVDDDTGNYGEWYMFLNLSGLVTNLDAVDIQWFQIYSVPNPNMRLSFTFLDSGNNTLFSQDFNTSGTQSAGWNGSVAASTFERQFQRLEVPTGTTQLRVNFASGGSSGVTGIMVIDDLSVRLSKPLITGIAPQSGGFNLTWNSMSSKSYTVQFAPALTAAPAWIPLVTNLSSAGLSTSYLDMAPHSGGTGFYRVVQE